MRGAIAFDKLKKKYLKTKKARDAYNEEHIRASVAIQIAVLRNHKSMTQQNLAKLLHTTQQTVSKLEKTDNNVTLSTLEKIAEIFGKRLQIKFV